MQLEQLPEPIHRLILDYKAEFDRILRLKAFFDTVMRNLLFWGILTRMTSVLGKKKLNGVYYW